MDMITAEPLSHDLARNGGMHLERPHPRRGLKKRNTSSPEEKSVDLKDSERDSERTNGNKEIRQEDSNKSKGHHFDNKKRGLWLIDQDSSRYWPMIQSGLYQSTSILVTTGGCLKKLYNLLLTCLMREKCFLPRHLRQLSGIMREQSFLLLRHLRLLHHLYENKTFQKSQLIQSGTTTIVDHHLICMMRMQLGILSLISLYQHLQRKPLLLV